MEVDTKLAKIDSPSVQREIKFFVKAARPLYEIRMAGETGDEICVADQNLFDALARLRRELERAGWRLLCNASRPNVAVSSAYRNQHGGGNHAYVLQNGRPADSSHMVDIFEAAAFDETASVAEQEKFHKNWISSLS